MCLTCGKLHIVLCLFVFQYIIIPICMFFSGSVVEHSLPHPVVEVLVLSNILYPTLL